LNFSLKIPEKGSCLGFGGDYSEFFGSKMSLRCCHPRESGDLNLKKYKDSRFRGNDYSSRGLR
jgi:hypothetical protein